MTPSHSASCWMVVTRVGSSSEWGLLCITLCRGRWEVACWSLLPSSLSRDAKSWVIVSSPSAAHANGEVACLEDILLQNKETKRKHLCQTKKSNSNSPLNTWDRRYRRYACLHQLKLIIRSQRKYSYKHRFGEPNPNQWDELFTNVQWVSGLAMWCYSIHLDLSNNVIFSSQKKKKEVSLLLFSCWFTIRFQALNS